MPGPTAPFSSSDITDNYFSGGRRITRGSSGGWPTLAAILQDVFSRIDLKNGRANVVGAAVTVAVAFGTAYADASYSVVASSTEVTAGLADVNVFITNHAAAGFTANLSAAPGGADTVAVHWIAIHD